MIRKCYILLCLIVALIRADKPKKMICHDRKGCYPEVFEATDVFQVVHQDQILPPGLHIRINFNTGIKEAKIMDEGDENKNSVILVYQDGHIQSTEPVDKEIPHSHLDEIKPNLKIPQEDHDQFSMALSFLESDKYQESEEDLTNILLLLEELSHELEFGIRICKSRIIVEHLMHLLKSSKSIHVKKLAITVLGSSLQNNPQALLHISDLKLVKILLEKLDDESDDSVMIKILYTLSSIVRSQNEMEEFHLTQGDKILYKVFEKTQNPALISKCANFVADNYLKIENYDHDRFKASSLSFSMSVDSTVKHWCKSLQKKFLEIYLNIDSKEKILSALSSLRKKHSNLCKPIDSFLEFLDHEIASTHSENNSYITLLSSVQYLFKDSNA
ncbi:uncharacterized protein T551_03289 [Pneumocystis jirovecii RU7]|nr:uncharacterized protein T551_03289 [Pneumocystis jirovecii RU7]KTW26827.1 hypothetical protein T551_03289 [Pneumocystis jirovecii RU7]